MIIYQQTNQSIKLVEETVGNDNINHFYYDQMFEIDIFSKICREYTLFVNFI